MAGLLSQAEVLRHVVAEAVHAESVGARLFWCRRASPTRFRRARAFEVVLAAIAGKTPAASRSGLRSTRPSTDDPVRVFQRFSTLNAISNRRAEVILGRGSFTESYPLFGTT